MQQISNKNLMFLLLLAIVVSVAGTMISINRITQLTRAPLVTGFASSTSGTGMVNVTVAALASIAAQDTIIHFGSCSPPLVYGCNASSNLTNANFGCSCTGGSAPDNLTIKNDGNKDLNVTVQTDRLASTFVGGSTPRGAEMYFISRNGSTSPGCYNLSVMPTTPDNFSGDMGLQFYWKNFTAAATQYLACANLTSTGQFELFVMLMIPANAPATSGTNATLTFTAVQH